MEKIYILIASLLSISSMSYSNEPADLDKQSQTGPTLKLAYDLDEQSFNSVEAFMYFIPLTSPTSMNATIQDNTTLSATVTTWKAEQVKNQVYVQCDFVIKGEGSYCAFYDPGEMIADCLADKTKTKQLSELLDWIRLSGSCQGHIQGRGKVVDQTVKMEYIEVQFNDKNTISPVEVGIYDVPRKNDEFLYKNRRNGRVARINTLVFKDTGAGKPRMYVELASIKKEDAKEGFFSTLTAMIANMLSTTTPVSLVGNETMMKFGQALYQKEQAFTFPLASKFTLSFSSSVHLK